jgi:hypothetical protein
MDGKDKVINAYNSVSRIEKLMLANKFFGNQYFKFRKERQKELNKLHIFKKWP